MKWTPSILLKVKRILHLNDIVRILHPNSWILWLVHEGITCHSIFIVKGVFNQNKAWLNMKKNHRTYN